MPDKVEKAIGFRMFHGALVVVSMKAIAEMRATSYADDELDEREKKQTYATELSFGLDPNNEDEMLDWAQNNLDWDEVKSYASQITEPDPEVIAADCEDGWCNRSDIITITDGKPLPRRRKL